jgi:hypothetical protein
MKIAKTNSAQVAKEEMVYMQNISESLMLGEVCVAAADIVESI